MFEKLKDDPRIDKESLDNKIMKIESFEKKIAINDKNIEKYRENINDLKSELKCAEILLKEDISYLRFSETPDIIIKLNKNIQYGVEVTRIRTRPEDNDDDKRLEKKFTRYAIPRTDSNNKEIPWSKYVEDSILKKMDKKYKTEKTLLCIDSHSPHQIDQSQIEEGIKNAIKTRSKAGTFEAIMYKTQFVSSYKTDIIFLNSLLEDSYFYSLIKESNNFIIK